MTEASHLRTLRVLDLVFYQRLRREGHLSREELALLFPNLPELIEIHSKAAPPPSLGLRGSRWMQLSGDTRNEQSRKKESHGESLEGVFPGLAGWIAVCCPRRGGRRFGSLRAPK